MLRILFHESKPLPKLVPTQSHESKPLPKLSMALFHESKPLPKLGPDQSKWKQGAFSPSFRPLQMTSRQNRLFSDPRLPTHDPPKPNSSPDAPAKGSFSRAGRPVIPSESPAGRPGRRYRG